MDGTKTRTTSWWQRQLPPSPLARSLSVQSILFAVGEGTFFTGSAVFFTQIVGLSAAQVGIGLTVAGITSFFFAVPAGKLADRIGTKRIWAVSAALTAALYLVWPFIGGTLGSVWAPALFTFLAMEHGSLGWVTIAAIAAVSTFTMGPAARAAERYLAQHGSAV